MKLMIVAPFDSKGRYKGGISSIVNTLYDSGRLQEKGIEVIKFDTCQIDRTNVAEAGVNFQNLRNAYLIYTELPKDIIKENPDTIYYHTSVGAALVKDCLVIEHIKRLCPNTKVVIHIHFAEYNKIMPKNHILRKWTMSILKRYPDKIIFLSENTREEFVKNGIYRKNTAVIYNFSTLSFQEDDLIKYKSGKLKFLFVGAISQRKGVMDALLALKKVIGEYEFHICGDFANTESRDAYFRLLGGIEDKIVFHGFVKGEEKERIFANCDIIVLPSYGEGLPVVILEGYSAGCAIIASNVGAIPEIVNVNNGIIINPGDIDKLAIAMQKYIDEGRSKLSKQQSYNYREAANYTIASFADSVFSVCYE